MAKSILPGGNVSGNGSGNGSVLGEGHAGMNGQQASHEGAGAVKVMRPRGAGFRFRTRHACAALWIVFSIILLVGGILVVLHFRDLVDGIIRAKVPLKSDSDVTKTWLNPPIKPALKLYFFNMTNVEAFLRGDKPRLQEVGPYVYQEIWEKVDVSWLNDGLEVEYGQKKTFFFDEKNSVGLESDLLMLPNVPMITAIGGKMKHANPLVRKALGAMLDLLKQGPFAEVSVRDIVWGFPHPLIKLGNEIAPEGERLPFDEFGFFVGKNGTAPGLMRAITGIRDVRELGQILSFAGKSELKFWKTDKCNEIKGTDGSVFHPGISRNETLFIFNKDLCRALPLVYQEDVVANGGIPGYRFVPPANVFATPAENPYNECFNLDSEDGPPTPSGLFNISACQFGAPIMLSWPHFFQADPRLLETVDGLNPSAEKHQFFLDIQPKLGSGLRAKARTQINVVLSPANDMKAAEGLRDLILPVVWFAEGIDGIDDEDTLDLLKAAIFTPETARSIMYPVLFSLGVLVLLIVLAYFATKKCSKYRRQKAEMDNAVQFSQMATYKTVNGNSSNMGREVADKVDLRLDRVA